MAGGKASAKKIELAERRRLAVTLRKQGGTFRQIAEQLRKVDGVSENYSQSDAYKDVVHELRRLEEEQAEDVLTLRRLELERLEEMWSALWGPFKKGDYAAFDRLVTVMNQRGRYLPVFDQSDKTTNVNLAGGSVLEGDTEYLVRTLNEYRGLAEIAEVVHIKDLQVMGTIKGYVALLDAQGAPLWRSTTTFSIRGERTMKVRSTPTPLLATRRTVKVEFAPLPCM